MDRAYAAERVGFYIEYEREHFDKKTNQVKMKRSGMAVGDIAKFCKGMPPDPDLDSEPN